jgi:3-oxoacyl-[acyl-carrier-protein] synthase II
LFTGSVEELCPQSAWAHRALMQQGRRHDVPLGEGAAMFSLERADAAQARGAAVAAHVLALQYGRWFDADQPAAGEALAAVLAGIAETLQVAGLRPQDIDAAVLCGAADAASSALEQEAAAQLLRADAQVFGLPWVQELGDTYSAGVSLGLAQLLVTLRAGQCGMVLIVGADGHAGCLLVRVPRQTGVN